MTLTTSLTRAFALCASTVLTCILLVATDTIFTTAVPSLAPDTSIMAPA